MTDELETVGKVADATKEVATTTGKAIDAASGVGHFFEQVMGDLIKDAVGLISDRVKYYRAENAVKLALRTQARLKKLGVADFRVVPPKVALPLIEQATIEDEPELQVMWANLLAAAMNPAKQNITRKYVSILGELTAVDAKLFQYLFSYSEICDEKEIEKSEYPVPLPVEFDPRPVSGLVALDPESFDEAMRTLGRLGLFTSGEELALDSFQQFPEMDGMSLARKFREDSHKGVYDVRVVRATQDITEKTKLTPFGAKFAEAIGLECIDRKEFAGLE